MKEIESCAHHKEIGVEQVLDLRLRMQSSLVLAQVAVACVHELAVVANLRSSQG